MDLAVALGNLLLFKAGIHVGCLIEIAHHVVALKHIDCNVCFIFRLRRADIKRIKRRLNVIFLNDAV